MENETLIGVQQASHVRKFLLLPQANPGKLHVTNMRVVFKATQGRIDSEFELPLLDIAYFSVGMANTLTLTTKEEKTYKLTGMFNKKLIGYLESAGVKKS